MPSRATPSALTRRRIDAEGQSVRPPLRRETELISR
jgi:hypothetical protein